MIVVSDTSPIRGLLSIKKTDLLEQLFDSIVIPKAVEEELYRIKAVDIDIPAFLNKSWVKVMEIKNTKQLNELRKHIDSGESEAIILAKELNCNLILIDEDKGRRIAKSLDIEVLGLIGILVLAKQKGLLNEIKPLLDDLRDNYGFWINNELFVKIIKSVNE